MSARIRVAALVGIAALGIALGVAFAFARGGAELRIPEPVSLATEINAVDALATGTVLGDPDLESTPLGVIATWQVEVNELHFSARNPVAADRSEDAVFIPEIPLGSVIRVRVALNDSESVDTVGVSESEGALLLALSYVPANELKGDRTAWVVRFAAAAGPTGTVVFRSQPIGPLLRGQLDHWKREASSELTDVEFLRAWVVERDLARGGDADPGPISASVAVNGSGTERWEEWYELPASERPLDIEAIPPQELGNYVEVRLLVDIESSSEAVAGDRGTVLEISSPSGVVHRAALTAGNHSIRVLARPGDELIINVLREEDADPRYAPVTVAASVWEMATDGSTWLLIARDQMGDSEAQLLEASEGAALLNQWAEANADDAETTEP